MTRFVTDVMTGLGGSCFNVLLIGWKQKIAVLLLFINNVLLFKKGMYELIIYNEFNKMHL